MFDTDDLRNNFILINEAARNTALEYDKNPDEIKLIAVSKTQPGKVIEMAIKSGIAIFGENYVQELCDKYDYLESKGIPQPKWHFIGHLQSNKVKYIANLIDMIHSVDSYKLAVVISEQAKRYNRKIDILLQVNTSAEESKFGCEPTELISLAKDVIELENINLLGLMTIGSFSNDEAIVRQEFVMLRNLLDKTNNELGLNMSQLSMGMSSDYQLAIKEGATMVRVGTSIFGPRIYRK
jgi:PLP dependent protein